MIKNKGVKIRGYKWKDKIKIDLLGFLSCIFQKKALVWKT